MAKKISKNSRKSIAKSQIAKSSSVTGGILGFHTKPWLTSKAAKSRSEGPRGRIIVFGVDVDPVQWLTTQISQVPEWQLAPFKAQTLRPKEVVQIATQEGPLWIVRRNKPAKSKIYGQTVRGRMRDLMGQICVSEDARNARALHLQFVDANIEEQRGVLVGLELCSYAARSPNGERIAPLFIENCDTKLVEECSKLGVAVNIARHLCNAGPADLHPGSYAKIVQQLFAKSTSTKVEVWQREELLRQECRLLLAVGDAASHPAVMVRIKYRPKKGNGKRPWAFVGKGVTFDSGGLDIKPAAGMRWMKKDMAGSGSLVGLAFWLEQTQCRQAVDIYLSLAENAVSAAAFHPGDVIKARNGLTVEIHNTDAEGRLVMADAFDVAIKQEDHDKPQGLINLATLTGAMRVAVGTEVAGYFANDEELAKLVEHHAECAGEKVWRLPLVKEYEAELKSTVADLANASPSGFGGAITAALFLERFVGQTPWLHVDMYGWTERPNGALIEAGGNGQMVQTLASFLAAF